MDLLKRQRASIKSKVTRVHGFLSADKERTLNMLQIRYQSFEEAWKDYQRIHQEMLAVADEAELAECEEDFAEMEDKCFGIKAMFHEELQLGISRPSSGLKQDDKRADETASSVSSVSDTASGTHISSVSDGGSVTVSGTVQNTSLSAEVKLPRLDLPNFSGEHLDWCTFRELFSSLVHENSSIPTAQKFYYLKSTLSGEAAGMIQSLEVSSAGYEEAWKLLNERYHNPRLLVQCHLKAIVAQGTLAAESAAGLRKLMDTTTRHTRALKSLGVATEAWDELLVFLIVEKMDGETRRDWELAGSGDAYPGLQQLREYVERRCRALEASSSRGRTRLPAPPRLPTNRTHMKPFASMATTTQVKTSDCGMCGQRHLLHSCREFQKLSIAQRLDWLKRHSLCFNCLGTGHAARNCHSQGTCHKCHLKHHTLIHAEATPVEAVSGTALASTAVTTHGTQHSAPQAVMLSTAVVNVYDTGGTAHPCRVLLDSGSQATFISESLVQRLGLRRARERVTITGIGHQQAVEPKGVVTVHMGSRHSSFVCTTRALILPTITNYQVSKPTDIDSKTTSLNIMLAETFEGGSRVDMLLGADVFGDLLLDGHIKLPDRGYTLYNTHLGWVCTGQISNGHQMHGTGITAVHVTVDLQQFWELEEVPSSRCLSPQENWCEEFYARTYQRNSEGRYCVGLPRKEGVQLGQSRAMVVKRWLSIESKLKQSPDYKHRYADFMLEYLTLGHMQLIPPTECQEELNKTNYLPHHFVLKEDSTTTGLRVVFDASARTTSGSSLNDSLISGPTLQDELWKLLLRFRLHKFGLTADIAKMYRQVNVFPRDADLQRIVWRADPNDPLQEYRLVTVTYGTAAAPYLAIKTLQQLALDDGDAYPMAKQVTLRDFYVDDLITGVDTIDKGLELQGELVELLSRGGFHLRKWASNHPALLEAVPQEDRQVCSDHSLQLDQSSVKALGLSWRPVDDSMGYSLNLAQGKECNKRTILSDISKLFDPLGWLSPVIILGKIFIQKLWLAGVSWDERLPGDLKIEWMAFRERLVHVQQIRIPRYIGLKPGACYELHGFCDSSELAYGAAVYLRAQSAESQVSVHLLMAKTRVAPVKQVSLPRLELCGAVLLAKLLTVVRNALHVSIQRVTAWTDSSVVLDWISSPSRSWKTFVANRVSIIHELTSPTDWRHVPGRCNPADVASRGISPQDLEGHALWWKGPDYLLREEEHWPARRPCNSGNEASRKEMRHRPQFEVLVATNTDFAAGFSSLTRLKRITAYCLRFVKNCRTPKSERIKGPLSTRELEMALTLHLRAVQEQAFGQTISNIKRGLLPTNNLLSLSPFLGEDGLLHVGGRLRHSSIPYVQRFPVLLPKSHHVTDLIIKDIHLKHMHAGPQATLAALQHKFWVINGRSVVRGLLHRCHRCVRDRAQVISQQMGDLPEQRVQPTRPFLVSGVDYAGPFSVKSGGSRKNVLSKVYVCLFICFATKAIHLELVTGLGSEAFIAAFRRFIARRGICKDLYSDNGTTFKGADRQLKELLAAHSQEFNRQVSASLAAQGTNWHYIPARAPHFGGLWEAGVKAMKTRLRRVVGNVTLTFEEFYTLLTQVESCLNSRPLSPLSSDPSDLRALTPGHFLIGEALTAVPEPSVTHIPQNRLSRWQLIQQMLQHIWRRWHQEVLTQLQQRPKWHKARENVKVGDLVLIKEDNLPPLQWALGRVTALFPGKDELVRVAEVRSTLGTLRRPIVKLCILPMPPL